jgi:hypothetical protein
MLTTIPDFVIQYGNLAVLIWIAFEVRDVRREFKQHLNLHHDVRPRRGSGA